MVWCDDTKPCVTAEHAGVRVQNKNLPEIIYSPIILHSYANFVFALTLFVHFLFVFLLLPFLQQQPKASLNLFLFGEFHPLDSSRSASGSMADPC